MKLRVLVTIMYYVSANVAVLHHGFWAATLWAICFAGGLYQIHMHLHCKPFKLTKGKL